MSYIKSAFIIDGIGKIVEVHGATWLYLDIQKYARKIATHYHHMIQDTGSLSESLRDVYSKLAGDYESYAEAPGTINSGLAREIWDLGLSPLSNSNKDRWARFLLKEDIPGHADNSDEAPAVLADFDRNRFYDTDRNFYAKYEDTLPEGWAFERITQDRMVEMLEHRLPEADRPKLRS